MQPFQNTNIQVTKVEMKVASTGNVKYILTAQDGKKYFFYQKAKGVDCDVFQTFQNMGVKQGMTIAIGFAEEPKSFQNPKGETVNYTDRFIGSMREASGVPAQTPTQAPKAPVKSNLSEPAYVSEAKDEKFWDKKAYKQCLWGQALKVGLENFGSKDCDLVWNSFKSIEQDADKRFAQGWDKAVKTFGTDQMPCNEEAPLPEAPPEIDIPF